MDATWEMTNAAGIEQGLAGERLGGAELPDVAALGRAILSDAMSRTAAEIARRAAVLSPAMGDSNTEAWS